MFILHWTDVSHKLCSAGLHCMFRHGKQRVVTLADVVAPKATGGIIHHLTTGVYLIYQAMWSLRKIHTLPSPGKWLYSGFTCSYYPLSTSISRTYFPCSRQHYWERRRNIHVLPSPGTWLHSSFTWSYCDILALQLWGSTTYLNSVHFMFRRHPHSAVH